jgi:hypothetical protein
LLICQLSHPSWALGSIGGIFGRGGIDASIGGLCWSGGGAPVPLRLYHFCGVIVMSYWQGRLPSMWFSQGIAGYLSIAVFTFRCPGNLTLHFLASENSV